VTLDNISSGDGVFIDANILVYRFSLHPQFAPPCRRLLDRIDQQDVQGVTSAHALNEAAYRMLTLEAMTQFGWPQTGINRRLRRHPSDIGKLTRYRRAIERILQSQLRIVEVTAQLVHSATDVSRQLGLLSNDALIVAIMQQHGLTNLASADTDFDRVPWIRRFAPE